MALTVSDVLRAIVTGDGASLNDPAWREQALTAIGTGEAAQAAPAADAGPDPRDAEIAALKARLAELSAAAEQDRSAQ